MFSLKVQFVTVCPPEKLNIPPPANPAVFPVNAQLVTVGLPEVLYIELLFLLYIPPPRDRAVLLLNVQCVTVGLLSSLYIPPPRSL